MAAEADLLLPADELSGAKVCLMAGAGGNTGFHALLKCPIATTVLGETSALNVSVHLQSYLAIQV